LRHRRVQHLVSIGSDVLAGPLAPESRPAHGKTPSNAELINPKLQQWLRHNFLFFAYLIEVLDESIGQMHYPLKVSAIAKLIDVVEI